ncbi:hypothetical protein HCN44_000461 [Aphidius gifuensis]|uniref:C2H2-type domain-containing protein n=1 Tax=Aphidius gifuensis TaxID=684658 RepID=A0A834XPR3_APHGI|nr:hypothetical protein HCN44_000461 [Aphidius gifuensis]
MPSQTCLLYKSKVLSQLICHKCAFEFDKCSNFVEKYKTTSRERQSTSHRQRIRHCSLCLEPGKPGYIHNLHVEKSSNALNKIKDIFQDNTALKINTAICLECRYNLDVLSDLIKIYKVTSSSFQDVFDSPKHSQVPEIETVVVKRKTTRIQLSKIQSTSKNNLDSPTVTRNESKANHCLSLSPKPRKTTSKDKLFNSINSSNDTKQCSVFLEDILPTSKDIRHNDDLKFKVEAYVSLLSNDSGSEQNGNPSPRKTRKLSKRPHTESENKDIQNKKIKKEVDTEELPKKRTRTLVKIPDYCELIKPTIKRRISETSMSDAPIEKRGRPRKYFKSDSPDNKKTPKSKSKSSVKKLNDGNFDSDENNEEIPVTRIRDKSIPSPSTSRAKKSLRKISDNINNIDDEFKNNHGSGMKPYTCSVCLIVYENKVEGLTHELTHSKKLGVILEKVLIPKTIDKKSKTYDEEINEKKKQYVSLKNLSKSNSIANDQNESEMAIEKLDEKIDSVDEEASTLLDDGTIIEKSTEKDDNDISKSLVQRKELTVINHVSVIEDKAQNNEIRKSDVIVNEIVQNKDYSFNDKEEMSIKKITENVGEKIMIEIEVTDTRNVEAQMEKIHEENAENRKAEKKLNDDNSVNFDISRLSKPSELITKRADTNSVELSVEKADENLSIIETDQKIQNNNKHILTLEDTSLEQIAFREQGENESVENNHNSSINNTENSHTEVTVQINNSPIFNDIELKQTITIPKFDEVNSNTDHKKTIEDKLLDKKVKTSDENHLKTNVEKCQEDQIDSNNDKMVMIADIRDNKLMLPKKSSIYQDISDDENSSNDVQINTDKSRLT